MSLDPASPAHTSETPTRLTNLRDLSTASPLVAAGRLLRSDAPHSADTHEAAQNPWPPRTVIDLRGDAEKREPHPYAASARIVDIPLAEESAIEAPNLTSLAELYRGMLRPPSADRLIALVSTIADAEPPVLVHCTAGKDRTGVAIAVTLSLLGVDRDEIVADYTRTAAAMPSVLRRVGITARQRADAPVLASFAPDLLEAPAEAMIGLLDALAERGGAEAWFLASGGDSATIGALRTRLLAR